MRHALNEQYLDLLGISETKLDASFRDGQFYVNNFKLYRQDKNDKGWGIMVYIKDCIPHRLMKDFSGSYKGIDYLTLEIVMKSRKWYVLYIYRPTSIKVDVLCELLELLCNNFIIHDNLFMAFGNVNSNFILNNTMNDL